MPLPSGAASGRRLYEQDAGLPDSFEAKDPELRNPSYPPPDEVTLDSAHSTRHSKEQHTPLAKERPVQSQRWWKRIVNTKHQRIFLLVILLQGLAVLALQGAIFGQLDQELDLDNRYLKSISVYLALFILAEITEILFALDALRLRNFLQVCGILIFSTAMLAYSALMYNQIRDALRDAPRSACSQEGTCPTAEELFHRIRGLIVAIPAVIGAATLALCLQSYFLYQDFSWDAFKLLGADLQIRSMYKWYMIFVVFLKFSVFFMVGFCMQLLILVPSLKVYEIGLTVAALPICIGLAIVAAIAVRTESRFGFALYALAVVAGMTYFIFKLVRIFQTSNNSPYASNRRSLGLFASICIALLAATALVSIKVFLNFGKGLARVLPRYSGKARRQPQEELAVAEDGRMELD